MPLERYYNLYDPSKHYTELLFRAGDGLQSRELNEIQSTLKAQLKGVGDALLKDGDIISGCALSIVKDSGDTHITAGIIYLAGLVRAVDAASFTLPIVGRVTVGVRIYQRTITELEDPTLREPAVGVRNYQEPGAGRLAETVSYAWVAADGTQDSGTGQFYPMMQIENGILQNKTRPPVFDGVTQMLARYDYDANGHYIVAGLAASFMATDAVTDENVFMLSSGTANVRGFKVTRDQDQRLRLPIDPDLETVQSEPHVFTPDSTGKMKIALNRAPLNDVLRISATVEKNVTLTRGAYSGGSDTLPDSTVIEVLSVKQGTTTYSAGTDYSTAGGVINWAPSSGIEPAPGSSYTVSYRYIKQLSADAHDDVSVTVSGAVANSIVQIDYRWKLPRIDSLTLSQDGRVQVVKGVSVSRNAQAPVVAVDQLRLANIHYHWFGDQSPDVQSVGVRTVTTAELQSMQQQINALYDLVAREQLKNDLTLRESASKKGIFVDPFLDNDLRDMGATQTAAIVRGSLMAPISATAVGPYLSTPKILPFTLNTLLEQSARTGSMKINAYAAILPMPATVLLDPSQDFWTETKDTFASDVTNTVYQSVNQSIGGGALQQVTTSTTSNTSRSTTLDSAQSQTIANLRQIGVKVSAKGFGKKEAVSAMRFDGVALALPTGLAADSSGVVSTSFTIPANTPAGTKLFEILGSGGSYGSAVFVGQGNLTVNTWRNRITTTLTTTTTTRWYDPLAQTFALPAAQMVAAIELWFTLKGSHDVTVQIRETNLGMPTPRALAEGRISASAIQTNSVTRIAFDTPVMLDAGTEYAICILTDDMTHELAIAELGKWDSSNSRWVTSQPYQIGVLLSSSNNSTWTPHQDKDLAFRLLAPHFSQTSLTLSLGSKVAVNAMTDVLVFASVERPATGTDVRFIATLSDGRRYVFNEGAGVSLPDAFTGKLDLTVELIGSDEASPVLAPDVLLLVASMSNTANYISRAMSADASFKVQVIADVYAPGTASVGVLMEHDAADNFVPVSVASGSPLGDGWVEMTWKGDGLSGVGLDKTTRVQLSFNNSPAYRAQVKNLRVIIT